MARTWITVDQIRKAESRVNDWQQFVGAAMRAADLSGYDLDDERYIPFVDCAASTVYEIFASWEKEMPGNEHRDSGLFPAQEIYKGWSLWLDGVLTGFKFSEDPGAHDTLKALANQIDRVIKEEILEVFE